MKERLIAGSNYIILFFNDIQQLNHNYSLYLNYMLELEGKYGPEAERVTKSTEEEKNAVVNLVQTLRHYSTKCFLQYSSIIQSLNKKVDKTISDVYNNKLIKNLIINRDDLKTFVIGINKALMDEVIVDLLKKAEDIYKDIYSDEQKTSG